MHIHSNAPLSDYTTMKLTGEATALTIVHDKHELLEAISWARTSNLPLLVLGEGSNVIFRDSYPGLVVINRLTGFEVTQDDAHNTTLTIAAGENWDQVVQRTVGMGLSGIEKLSAIPGTAGATPVQNVGAYGAEIAETFVQLEAYDLTTSRFVTLHKDDCQFAYRHSIFKSPTKRRYIITSITLRLTRTNPKPPFYDSLQRYLDEHHITTYTPQTIREAVIAVRAIRLPDPSVVPNTGSFFKNPIVPRQQYEVLAAKQQDMPHWPTNDGQEKLSAGWLIEHAGLKNYRAHGMRTYEHNALVVINDGAKGYNDLAAFRQEIVDTVRTTFGVTLQQEPELL